MYLLGCDEGPLKRFSKLVYFVLPSGFDFAVRPVTPFKTLFQKRRPAASFGSGAPASHRPLVEESLEI
jgi:hypothetical protein